MILQLYLYLTGSLNDENYFVRVNAANTLGMIGNQSSIAYLKSSLENSNGESQGYENALKNAIEKIKAKTSNRF